MLPAAEVMPGIGLYTTGTEREVDLGAPAAEGDVRAELWVTLNTPTARDVTLHREVVGISASVPDAKNAVQTYLECVRTERTRCVKKLKDMLNRMESAVARATLKAAIKEIADAPG